MNLKGRKYLNMLETPAAPFIQRDAPRFQWAGKFNNVQTDEVLRDTETKTQYYQDAVLAVSRDQNQRKYGIRSWYGPVVNKNFRPPLLDPELDINPLSRLPRPRTQVRFNPVSPYHTQNNHDPDVGAFMNPRKLNGAVINNIQVRFEKPTDYEIKPDLEFKRPQTCGPSGNIAPVHLRIEVGEHPYLQKNRPDVSVKPYENVPYAQFTPIDSDDIHLEYNRVQVGAEPYMTTPIQLATQLMDVYDVDLEYNRPTAGGKNAETIPYAQFTPIDSDSIELFQNTPIHDAYANPGYGVDTINYTMDATPHVLDRLQTGYHNAQISPISREDNQRNENVHLAERIQPGGYHTIGNLPTGMTDQGVQLRPTAKTNTRSSYRF